MPTGIDLEIINPNTLQKTTLEVAGVQSHPDLYSTKAVYQDNSAGNFNIYMLEDITSSSPSGIEIYSAANDQLYPKIYGNYVVFQTQENGNWDVYLYNTNSGLVTEIAAENYDEKYPDVYGTKVVWSDNRDGYWNIYMSDISSGQEHIVTSGENNYLNPSINAAITAVCSSWSIRFLI